MLDQVDQPLGCADRNAGAGLVEESDLLFQFEVLCKLQERQEPSKDRLSWHMTDDLPALQLGCPSSGTSYMLYMTPIISVTVKFSLLPESHRILPTSPSQRPEARRQQR